MLASSVHLKTWKKGFRKCWEQIVAVNVDFTVAVTFHLGCC